MGDWIPVVGELLKLANRLLDGTATEDDKRRVIDIVGDKSASEQAAEDIERAKRLEALHEVDDPADRDEPTWPGSQ